MIQRITLLSNNYLFIKDNKKTKVENKYQIVLNKNLE